MNKFLDITLDEYYSQSFLDKPALTSSIAKLLVNESPAHAWLQHEKLGNSGHDGSKEMDEGSILHSLVLGKGQDFMPIKYDSWRTNDAKQLAESIRSAGKIPILEQKFAELMIIADSCIKQISENTEIKHFFKGVTEQPIAWEFDDVQWISLLDNFHGSTIFDLKFVSSSRPVDLMRKIHDMGYDIQAEAYCRGLESIFPDLMGKTEFIFLFVEKTAPYCLTPVKLSPAAREIGQRKVLKANEVWSECLKTNKWPGYTTGIVTLEPPVWALKGLYE